MRRRVEDLVFVDTMRPNDEVICAYVPHEIRQILEPFKEIRQRVVFYKAFRVYVQKANVGPFADVAKIYYQAVSTYGEVCDKFTSGK